MSEELKIPLEMVVKFVDEYADGIVNSIQSDHKRFIKPLDVTDPAFWNRMDQHVKTVEYRKSNKVRTISTIRGRVEQFKVTIYTSVITEAGLDSVYPFIIKYISKQGFQLENDGHLQRAIGQCSFVLSAEEWYRKLSFDDITTPLIITGLL